MSPTELWWFIDAATPKAAKQKVSDREELLEMLHEAKRKESLENVS